MPAPAQVTLPSDREVRVTRQFNAPRRLVWDAHTTADLMPKWLGYPGWDMPVRDMDVRVGGKNVAGSGRASRTASSSDSLARSPR